MGWNDAKLNVLETDFWNFIQESMKRRVSQEVLKPLVENAGGFYIGYSLESGTYTGHLLEVVYDPARSPDLHVQELIHAIEHLGFYFDPSTRGNAGNVFAFIPNIRYEEVEAFLYEKVFPSMESQLEVLGYGNILTEHLEYSEEDEFSESE